ncbi:MAG: 1,4-alpha-glucan-branching enzyme, partial [Bacteroidales bacterium]|nr:1,4-alpha-glucan-branching enzyme [Bacteroidales bacterium]
MKDTLPFVERDPWLWPVAGRIEKRHADYLRTKAWIEAEYGSLYDFAGAHLYYGLHPAAVGADGSPHGWVFREWLPNAKDVFLTGDFNGWDYTSHPLRKVCGADGRWHGDWEIRLAPDDNCAQRLTHGSRYKIYVHGADGSWHLRMPAYTFYTEQDPDTKEFKAKVWAPDSPCKVSANEKNVGSREKNDAPFSPLIYEAHIGMAQEKEGVGTFREFTENVLPRIREDGYNTVQLMG